MGVSLVPPQAGFAHVFSDKLAAPTQGSLSSSPKSCASLCHINIHIYMYSLFARLTVSSGTDTKSRAAGEVGAGPSGSWPCPVPDVRMV